MLKRMLSLLAAALLLLDGVQGDHVSGHVPRPDVLAFDVVLCRDLASFARAANSPPSTSYAMFFFPPAIV